MTPSADGGRAPAPDAASVFGRSLRDTAAAYKFFWAWALLDAAQASVHVTASALLKDMVVRAWTPAVLYRLSFGHHDRLQDLTRSLQQVSGLRDQASPATVRKALEAWPGASSQLGPIARYVPTRFIAPWFYRDLPSGERDDARTRRIIDLSLRPVTAGSSAPYRLERSREMLVCIDPLWRSWFIANAFVVRGFIERELSLFLQARNPNVPAIPAKLHPPSGRRPERARRLVLTAMAAGLPLRDGVSGGALDDGFVLDHFLPRAFVAHDQLWNLWPLEAITNLRKGSAAPHACYIPSLARFHHALLARLPADSKELEDYALALGTASETLRALDVEHLEAAYVRTLAPLLQIASNQGFRAGWIAVADGGR